MPTPTTITRTWRLQAFTDLGQEPRIEFLREKVTSYQDGNEVHEQLPIVARTLAEIRGQPIPGGQRVVRTLGEIFDLVGEMGHELADEDDAERDAAARAAEAELAAAARDAEEASKAEAAALAEAEAFTARRQAAMAAATTAETPAHTEEETP